jgi:hypothetical protein
LSARHLLNESNVARNRPELGSCIRTEVNEYLIDIAPPPPFRRIIAFNNGVLGRMEMFCRVPVGRLVATANMPAGTADSQVHPVAAGLETLLATLGARMDAPNGSSVGTITAHVDSHPALAEEVPILSDPAEQLDCTVRAQQ